MANIRPVNPVHVWLKKDPITTETVSSGGIVIPGGDAATMSDRAGVRATVISAGSEARTLVDVGDRVIIGRWEGTTLTVGDEEYTVVIEDAIGAVITEEP